MRGSFKFIFSMGLLATVAVIWAALGPPHFSYHFQPRDLLVSEKGQITLDEMDFVAEPGDFQNFADLERFYERQGQIFHIVSGENLRVQNQMMDTFLLPTKKKLWHLTPLFWIQILVGLATFWISGWVWCLRSRDLPSTFFWASGFCVLMATLPSAVYTTRELTLSKISFEILGFFNVFGGGLFGSTIITLFLVHPVKIARWKGLSLLQWTAFTIPICLYAFRVAWANVNVGIVAQMGLICVVVGYQLWLSRDHQESRGSLTWLGVSIIFGGGAFVVFNTIPVLLGMTALPQGYSFLFLFFIYLGIGAGLTQFHIFRLQRRVFYLCFYAFGVAAFALLYAGFFSVFRLGPWQAMGLALLIILILYVPLGESVWRSLHKK